MVAVHHPSLGCIRSRCDPCVSNDFCRFRQATSTRLRIAVCVAGALPHLEPCKVLQACRNFDGDPDTGWPFLLSSFFSSIFFHEEEPQSGKRSIQLCAVPFQSDRTHRAVSGNLESKHTLGFTFFPLRLQIQLDGEAGSDGSQRIRLDEQL